MQLFNDFKQIFELNSHNTWLDELAESERKTIKDFIYLNIKFKRYNLGTLQIIISEKPNNINLKSIKGWFKKYTYINIHNYNIAKKIIKDIDKEC